MNKTGALRDTEGATLGVLVPSFNESSNVVQMHKAVSSVLENLNVSNYEIVFINDGSSDDTLLHLRTLTKKDSRVTALNLSRNWGHQYALQAGLEYIDTDLVIMMDGDLQHPPELIPKMVDIWVEGADVVQAVRSSSVDPFFKRSLSKIFYRLLNFLSDTEIVEGGADFRLIDKKVLMEIKKIKESHLFLRGIFPWLGFNAEVVEYAPNQRVGGESSYNFRRMLRLGLDGVTSFSTRPLVLSSILGFVLVFLSSIYLLYVLGLYVFAPNIVIPGWASVISSMLFIGGVQLFSLGIIGYYIGKLYVQSKMRPTFIVKDVIKHE